MLAETPEQKRTEMIGGESDRLARFGLLLVGLLAELMLAPLFGTSEAGLQAGRAVAVLLLLVALWSVGAQRSAFLLFVPALIVQLIVFRVHVGIIPITAAVMRLLFFGYVTFAIVRHIVRQPEVTMDMIAAAACAYLLLGLDWAHLYILLEYVHPGSFDIPASFLVGRDASAALMYFSFTTLTTVGYGDIHPTEVGAGGIAVAEAVVGQLYLAIMIARMVALHIARRAG